MFIFVQIIIVNYRGDGYYNQLLFKKRQSPLIEVVLGHQRVKPANKNKLKNKKIK